MSNSDWANLPSVVLYEIFHNIYLKDRLNASSTCRKWREALFYYPNTRKLKIRTSPSSQEKNKFLAANIARFCKELTITYVATDYYEVVELVQCFPDHSGICDIRLVGSKDPERSSFATDFNDVIYPFLEKCSHIGKLFLSHWVNPERMKRLLVKHHKTLHAIGLENQVDSSKNVNVSPMLISVFEKCDKLEKLTLDSHLLSVELMNWINSSKSIPKLSVLTLRLDDKNTMGTKLNTRTWEDFNRYRPSCNIQVNYVHIQEPNLENILHLAKKISRLRLFYCSEADPQAMLSNWHCCRRLRHLYLQGSNKAFKIPETFKTACMARFMPEHNQSLESIWSISHPREDFDMADNPFVICAWRFVNLSEIILSGCKCDLYDLVGMSRLRPLLRIEIAVEDIMVGDREYLRPVTSSELKKLFMKLYDCDAKHWIPMKNNGYNDLSLPPADREALAFEQAVRIDLT